MLLLFSNRRTLVVRRTTVGLELVIALAVVIGCAESGKVATNNGATSNRTTNEITTNGAGANSGEEQPAAISGSIAIDGSSTVYPVTEAVAEEFQNSTKGAVRITVGIAGTGGGFKRFTRGETDISDASRPILAEEMEQARTNNIEYIELPVCFDALTVVVNPANDWVDHFTVEELKKIWEPAAQGTILRWNQVRPEWPDEELVLFGAGADSGTFDYFTEATVGKAKSSRGDFTASEDDNVLVQGVAGNKYGLGYFGYAYYPPNADKVKAVAIDWEKDDLGPQLPSEESVLKGTYNPLSRPLFIYVSKAAAKRPEVAKFVEFYLTNVPELAAEVKYVPLPPQAYEMALERFRNQEGGTGFGGKPEVGLTIEEILKRQPKH
jgi:phosphate transport system substrate-binding protein